MLHKFCTSNSKTKVEVKCHTLGSIERETFDSTISATEFSSKLTFVCDRVMPKRNINPQRRPIYWMCEEISNFRKECIRISNCMKSIKRVNNIWNNGYKIVMKDALGYSPRMSLTMETMKQVVYCSPQWIHFPSKEY